MSSESTGKGQYAAVNGLQLYYEIYGSGFPLVLLHGGGSTIASNYGRILPELAKSNQVIALELQAHGHTLDIAREMTFEQDADDVAALLNLLQIKEANIMGFSNGGTTAIQVAIRHPQLVRKLVLASALTRRDGIISGFFEGMQHASIDNMPQPLKDAYLKANPSAEGLHAMFLRDSKRMIDFKDIPDELAKKITAPALIMSGDKDVILVEHSLTLSRLIPNAQLAILPGGHSDYLGEICTTTPNSIIPTLAAGMINEFLTKNGG
ncbi:alpha/beta fold hydrolase [Dyadobacter sp. CY326]|uniref:alpha/beta fold hydrolase n=1 Tax=Dyadobacter sp. CY326 TaxID=2907300 RepID=UPI001F1B4A13|nr:alpha/beta hydrolase [Dyadobacter sp. CY326]MCE7064987.1 alpha/beta hydrolase [Dyadobacter sp. CY326]